MADSELVNHISENPDVNCLLLCDDVTESKRLDGQKHTLSGIINSYRTPEMPVTVAGPVCYMRMMDLRPGAEVALKINHHNDLDDVVIELMAKIGDGADPTGMYTFIVPLPPLTFKQPGRYDLSVQHKGVAVVVSPIEIEWRKPKPPAVH